MPTLQERVLAHLRAHPGWSTISPVYQERIEVLALGARDEDIEQDILSLDSPSQLAEQYRSHGWTASQWMHTLAALRHSGLAHSDPQHVWVKDKRGRMTPRQAPSAYKLTMPGTSPQAKRPRSPALLAADLERRARTLRKQAAALRRGHVHK